MVKNILLGLLLVVSGSAYGQRTLDATHVSNVNAPTNYVVNPGAEKNLTGAVNAGSSTFARSTTSPIFGNGSYTAAPSITCSSFPPCNSGFTLTIRNTSATLDGQNCMLQFWASHNVAATSGTSYRAQLKNSGSVIATAPFAMSDVSGKAQKYEFNYPCNSAINQVTFDNNQSGGGGPDAVTKVDYVYWGQATNIGSGPIVTAWKTATSNTALQASTSNPTTNSATVKWRQIGDSAEINWTYNILTAGSGAIYLPLPDGLVLDLTKTTLYGVATGSGRFYDQSAGTNYNLTPRINNGATGYITAALDATPIFTTAAPVAFANGDDIVMSAILPIVGFTASSSVVSLTQTAVTTGTYAPFDTASCPQGWALADGSNGTIDLRAMFVRGAGTQTVGGVSKVAGTLGSAVADQFQGHWHNGSASGGAGPDTVPNYTAAQTRSTNVYGSTANDPIAMPSMGAVRYGTETYPSHRVMTWCKQTATIASPLIVATSTAPTIQRFLSGSGTYTKPQGVLYLKVRLVGGGGGGSGYGNTAPASQGGTGGTTTFGTSLLSAAGGTGGGTGASNATGGVGGTASLGTGPIGIAFSGEYGDMPPITGSTYAVSGKGGNTPFGPGGNSKYGGPGSVGFANSGGGGSGGGGDAASGPPAQGGGAGGYVDATIYSPASTYSYAVGAGGTAGVAGTGNPQPGGAGATGQIEVTEYYQ